VRTKQSHAEEGNILLRFFDYATLTMTNATVQLAPLSFGEGLGVRTTTNNKP